MIDRFFFFYFITHDKVFLYLISFQRFSKIFESFVFNDNYASSFGSIFALDVRMFVNCYKIRVRIMSFQFCNSYTILFFCSYHCFFAFYNIVYKHARVYTRVLNQVKAVKCTCIRMIFELGSFHGQTFE